MCSNGIVYFSIRVAHPYLQYEWISRELIFHTEKINAVALQPLRKDENLFGEKHTRMVTKWVTFVGRVRYAGILCQEMSVFVQLFNAAVTS